MGKPRDLANVVATGNILADGAVAPAELTGVNATAAELNILDGVTATAAELNLLDGVTATTAELNHVDGVTSNVQTQIDTKAPVASPTFTGTATAPTINASTALQIGGVAITATAAELNIMDGVTASASDINGVAGINSNVQTQLNLKAPLASPTFTGNVSLGDNVKLKLGDGEDLQIYHDGTDSYINDTSAGNLKVLTNGNGIYFQTDGGENLARFVKDGDNALYYNNSNKLATTASGADVTGLLNTDNLTINGAQGSNGQVLTSTGSGVGWADAGGGAYELIQKQTISSAVSSVTFTTTTAPQGQLLLILNGVRLNADGYVQLAYRDSSGNLLNSDGNGEGYYETGYRYDGSGGNGQGAEDNISRIQLNSGNYYEHLRDIHSQVNIFGWGTTQPFIFANTLGTTNTNDRIIHTKLASRFSDRTGGTTVPTQIHVYTQIATGFTTGDIYLYKLV